MTPDLGGYPRGGQPRRGLVPLDPAAAGYARTLLDQLAWWAGALRTAREAVPHPA